MAVTLSGKEVGARALSNFSKARHNSDDPSPWLALFLDQSLPMEPQSKASYLTDISSPSRQYLLPLLRPITKFAIMFNQVLKIFLPNFLTSSKLLHYLIYLGQKYFVSPEANYVILRHFHIGSQILKFLSVNILNTEVTLKSIRPTELKDIYKDEIYLNHDINLYNFIIQLNDSLRKSGKPLEVREPLDFSMIEQGDFNIQNLRDSIFNFLDVETAIELYTPIFQLLLRDSDFWRAHHSLQFDETIAIYIAQILKNANHLGLSNNKHPLAPMPGTGAAFRLVLHGISSELLHGALALRKRAQLNKDTEVPLQY